MRKTLLHIMAVVLIGLTSTGTLNARTSGDDDDYKTKTYDVGTISSIDANGLFSVVYEQTSGATEVAVKTKDKVFECLEVKNDDGMLVLKLNLKEGKSYSLSPIEVKVRTKHLTTWSCRDPAVSPARAASRPNPSRSGPPEREA